MALATSVVITRLALATLIELPGPGPCTIGTTGGGGGGLGGGPSTSPAVATPNPADIATAVIAFAASPCLLLPLIPGAKVRAASLIADAWSAWAAARLRPPSSWSTVGRAFARLAGTFKSSRLSTKSTSTSLIACILVFRSSSVASPEISPPIARRYAFLTVGQS